MRMKRIKIIGLALVAMFAVSATAATAALAVEGPFYKVEGTRVASGTKKERKVEGTSAIQELKSSIGVKIKCKKVGVESGANIVGQAIGTGGTSEETLKYTECTVEGDGSSCKVKGSSVTTELLANREGYELTGRAGNLVTGFKPKSGSVFATLKFEGTCTFGLENKVELGSGKTVGVVCFDENEAGAKVSVTANQAEHIKNKLECPATKLAKMFYETGGATPTELQAGLVVGGGIGTSEYVGNSAVEGLEGGV